MVGELSLTEDAIAKPNPEVSIQGRTSAERDYYFIMNFSEQEQQLTLVRNVVDLETNQAVPLQLSLAPYEVRVVYLEE